MTIGRLFLSAALTFYIGLVAANGLDRISGRVPAVERLVPWPFRSQADRAAAETDLVRKDVPGALRHASAAVSHDPVDRDSAAFLGSARLQAGNEDRAADAFRVAARFGWRNIPTQLYWLQASLQAGEAGLAVDRADAILRAYPAFVERDRLLEALESDPAALPYLRAHLAARPNWLAAYLQVPKDADDALLDRKVMVLTEGTPLGCKEISWFASALVDRNRRADAEKVWNVNCPQQRVDGLLADRDFAKIDARPGYPFGWRAMRSGEVEVRNDPSGAGIVVRNSAPFVHLVLSQPVALPPGEYRISLRGDGSGPGGSRLRFSIGCDGALPQASTVSGDPMAGGQVLRVGSCAHQQLGLWLSPGSPEVKLTSVSLEKIG